MTFFCYPLPRSPLYFFDSFRFGVLGRVTPPFVAQMSSFPGRGNQTLIRSRLLPQFAQTDVLFERTCNLLC